MTRPSPSRTAILSLILLLLTAPLWAAPSPPAPHSGLLASLWRAILEIVVPPAAGGPSEPVSSDEQTEGDLGPTLDPIG